MFVDNFDRPIEVGSYIIYSTSFGRSDSRFKMGRVTKTTKAMIMFVDVDDNGNDREPEFETSPYHPYGPRKSYEPRHKAMYTNKGKFLVVSKQMLLELRSGLIFRNEELL